MNFVKRIFICAIAASGSIFWAGVAMAQSVTVDIEGTLAASCNLSNLPIGVQNLGDLNAAGSKVLNFTVDCNAPFAYAITSGNLGLKYASAQENVIASSAGFETLIPYTISTNFQTDGAAFGDNSLEAANLTVANATNCVGVTYSSACPFANSGTNAAATGKNASLTVNWNGINTKPRLAGSYSDTVTITVRVK